MDGTGMRALKAATVIMGVLILVGTAVLIAVIIKRSTSPAPAPDQATAAMVPSTAPYMARLAVPPGSRITGIAETPGGLLAISVAGGNGTGDEVAVVDPTTGRPVGTITLAPR